jgi:hypothetical protein
MRTRSIAIKLKYILWYMAATPDLKLLKVKYLCVRHSKFKFRMHSISFFLI